MSIARVEPLTTARALRGPFDYRLPDRLADVGVGTVLRVPFGRRRVLGVVVELAERSALPAERLAEPIEALAAGAPAELVRLGLWVAREYCSTPARGLELVLPPGTGGARGQLGARTETVVAACAAAAEALASRSGLGPRQRRALELLPEAGDEVPAARLTTQGIGRDALRRLERRGLVRLAERPLRRRPRGEAIGAPARRVALDDHQRAAVERIVAALDGDGAELLLHGVTGSGKTEVYLAAAEAALERDLGAIVLVPEIAMTPQALGRFRSRFGERVAVLHSRLGAGERRDEWQRCRDGEARICVGPRSAVFAPIADLGLIVVDEEHDPSYKQESDPRYDAREVARRRAAARRAPLVLGSATPRPESWLALERLELPRRVDGRGLPEVEVIDMRARDGREGPLAPRTREALADLRDARAKGIVMVNRRGWSVHLSCRSCGRAWGCPQCDVSLVVHSDRGRRAAPGGAAAPRRGRPQAHAPEQITLAPLARGPELRCHHCGHAEPVPDACPECGSVTLRRSGSGSERIESEIAAAIAPLPVFRLDTDSAARHGGPLEPLAAFEAAPAGVLVGTQMVAKGHDFPDVVLGVVVDADSSLRFPDLRAEERTFALVAQLAGRSGRGRRPGRVLVQTLAPEASAIRHAARHDAAGFLAEELERRRELDYPPFRHLIRIEVTAAEGERAQEVAERLRAQLAGGLPAQARALGPAPRFRLRGRERRQLLIKAADRAPAVAAVREAIAAVADARMLRDVALSVDVDAQ